MTREEIIEGLKLLEDNMVYFDELLNDKGEYIDVHELLFEAIKALEQEPKETWSIKDVATTFERHGLMTEQESCEDCISRAEALKNLALTNGKDDVYRMIRELPSIQPKPKTGHWIDHQDGRWIYVQCSECGTVHDTQTNYCPNCGAKMESEVPT